MEERTQRARGGERRRGLRGLEEERTQHACTKDKVSCSPEKISSGTFAAGKKF